MPEFYSSIMVLDMAASKTSGDRGRELLGNRSERPEAEQHFQVHKLLELEAEAGNEDGGTQAEKKSTHVELTFCICLEACCMYFQDDQGHEDDEGHEDDRVHEDDDLLESTASDLKQNDSFKIASCLNRKLLELVSGTESGRAPTTRTSTCSKSSTTALCGICRRS